ncbi:MAG TPA: substrate-binding domain-containing protein [Burkholderiales bacterium]|nr:substrate-binding domain-containing protein [Burkholderiales bacterium]
MKRKANARLADVARAAGVSLSTASRALGAAELVNERTRAKVVEAAAMLGYLPHGAARALATQRSRTVGAVFPPVDNPIFAAATQALAHELASRGYTLLLATHEYDPAGELAAARALLERGVDGLVLVGLDHDPELYRMLAQSGVPYELAWSLDPAGYQHCVGVPHRLASVRLTQHLLDLGHRELAAIAGSTARNDRARDRLAGTREALASHGLELPPERVIETQFSLGHGQRAMRDLLDRAPGFTAVVCGNDLLAIGALHECARRGIEVPRHMSVAGFDDIEMAAVATPPLTTVRVPAPDIGRLAAERMLARLAGEHVVPLEEVRAELIVRESTGRAPA